MKKQILIYLAITFILSGCGRNEAISLEESHFQKYFDKKEHIPSVNGKILNLTKEEIENTQLDYALVTPFESDRMQIKKYGSINSDGTFTLEIDYPFPYQQIWLHVGDYFYAGIYANDELFIELDADSMRIERAYMYGPGVKYSGADGTLNTILNKHVLYRRKEQLELGKSLSYTRRDKSLADEIFLRKYDSLYSLLHEIDDEFISKNPSPYSKLIKNERMSAYYGDLCVRYWGQSHKNISEALFDDIKSHKAYLISNDGACFYDYLVNLISAKSGKYDPVDFSNFTEYSQLDKSQKMEILKYTKIKELKKSGMSYDTIQFETLGKSIFKNLSDTLVISRTIKTINYIDSLFDNSKADFLKMKLSSKDLKESMLILEILLEDCKTKWVEEILQTNSKRILDNQSKIDDVLKSGKKFNSNFNIGEPILELPFGARLFVVEDIDPGLLLSNIKSAFNGKALILDFWATWCAPCLVDLPYSKKLHDEMKDEAIEFVYLCTSRGSDIDTWKSKISDLELGGTHIFVEASLESKLMSLLSLGGFPSYGFINAKGEYKAGAISRMSKLKKENLLEIMNDN